MGRLVVTQNVTLDGRIEMLDDWFDPVADEEDLNAHVRGFMTEEQAVLLGRQTFEDFRGYWPHRTDDPTGISDQLDRVRNIVISVSLPDPGWEHTEVLPNATPETIRGALETTDGEVVCTGSIRLTHALLADDLVDELRLYTFPVVQGRGRRLFPDGHRGPSPSLADTATFAGGVVYAAYSLR